MACMAYITTPSNGQNVLVPLNASAGAMGMMGAGGVMANITAASWQLDDGTLMPLSCSSGGFNTSSAMFNFTVNGLAEDTWHMITLYVWDDQSSNSTTMSATFHVMASPPPIP